MVRITFKNGKVYEWGDRSCKEYKYDGKCFIVIGYSNDLGIYNMDDVSSVEAAPDPAGSLPEGDAQGESQQGAGLPAGSQAQAHQDAASLAGSQGEREGK